MIVVTIELWPGGDKKDARTLGVAHIANTGEGSNATGFYTVKLFKWTKGGEVWRRGRVANFPRKVLGPWDLLYAALHSTLAERIPRIMECIQSEQY